MTDYDSDPDELFDDPDYVFEEEVEYTLTDKLKYLRERELVKLIQDYYCDPMNLDDCSLPKHFPADLDIVRSFDLVKIIAAEADRDPKFGAYIDRAMDNNATFMARTRLEKLESMISGYERELGNLEDNLNRLEKRPKGKKETPQQEFERKSQIREAKHNYNVAHKRYMSAYEEIEKLRSRFKPTISASSEKAEILKKLAETKNPRQLLKCIQNETASGELGIIEVFNLERCKAGDRPDRKLLEQMAEFLGVRYSERNLEMSCEQVFNALKEIYPNVKGDRIITTVPKKKTESFLENLKRRIVEYKPLRSERQAGIAVPIKPFTDSGAIKIGMFPGWEEEMKLRAEEWQALPAPIPEMMGKKVYWGLVRKGTELVATPFETFEEYLQNLRPRLITGQKNIQKSIDENEEKVKAIGNILDTTRELMKRLEQNKNKDKILTLHTEVMKNLHSGDEANMKENTQKLMDLINEEVVEIQNKIKKSVGVQKKLLRAQLLKATTHRDTILYYHIKPIQEYVDNEQLQEELKQQREMLRTLKLRIDELDEYLKTGKIRESEIERQTKVEPGSFKKFLDTAYTDTLTGKDVREKSDFDWSAYEFDKPEEFEEPPVSLDANRRIKSLANITNAIGEFLSTVTEPGTALEKMSDNTVTEVSLRLEQTANADTINHQTRFNMEYKKLKDELKFLKSKAGLERIILDMKDLRSSIIRNMALAAKNSQKDAKYFETVVEQYQKLGRETVVLDNQVRELQRKNKELSDNVDAFRMQTNYTESDTAELRRERDILKMITNVVDKIHQDTNFYGYESHKRAKWERISDAEIAARRAAMIKRLVSGSLINSDRSIDPKLPHEVKVRMLHESGILDKYLSKAQIYSDALATISANNRKIRALSSKYDYDMEQIVKLIEDFPPEVKGEIEEMAGRERAELVNSKEKAIKKLEVANSEFLDSKKQFNAIKLYVKNVSKLIQLFRTETVEYMTEIVNGVSVSKSQIIHNIPSQKSLDELVKFFEGLISDTFVISGTVHRITDGDFDPQIGITAYQAVYQRIKDIIDNKYKSGSLPKEVMPSTKINPALASSFSERDRIRPMLILSNGKPNPRYNEEMREFNHVPTEVKRALASELEGTLTGPEKKILIDYFYLPDWAYGSGDISQQEALNLLYNCWTLNRRFTRPDGSKLKVKNPRGYCRGPKTVYQKHAEKISDILRYVDTDSEGRAIREKTDKGFVRKLTTALKGIETDQEGRAVELVEAEDVKFTKQLTRMLGGLELDPEGRAKVQLRGIYRLPRKVGPEPEAPFIGSGNTVTIGGRPAKLIERDGRFFAWAPAGVVNRYRVAQEAEERQLVVADVPIFQVSPDYQDNPDYFIEESDKIGVFRNHVKPEHVANITRDQIKDYKGPGNYFERLYNVYKRIGKKLQKIPYDSIDGKYKNPQKYHIQRFSDTSGRPTNIATVFELYRPRYIELIRYYPLKEKGVYEIKTQPGSGLQYIQTINFRFIEFNKKYKNFEAVRQKVVYKKDQPYAGYYGVELDKNDNQFVVFPTGQKYMLSKDDPLFQEVPDKIRNAKLTRFSPDQDEKEASGFYELKQKVLSNGKIAPYIDISSGRHVLIPYIDTPEGKKIDPAAVIFHPPVQVSIDPVQIQKKVEKKIRRTEKLKKAKPKKFEKKQRRKEKVKGRKQKKVENEILVQTRRTVEVQPAPDDEAAEDIDILDSIKTYRPEGSGFGSKVRRFFGL